LTVDPAGMAMGLSWQDNSDDEDGFVIEKQLVNGRFVVIHITGSNVEAYTDTKGINPNSTYTYRLRAYRGAALSGFILGEDSTGVWEEPICVEVE